jgi:hypothetical protein
LAGENVEVLKLDFNLSRMPIGAALAFVEFAAQWVAGKTNAARLCWTVKRNACLIEPLATST